jgi:hypothetical protein
MPTAAIATFGAGRVDPIKGPHRAGLESLNLQPSTTFAAGQILFEQSPGVYGAYTGASSSVGTTTAISETGTVGTYTVANSLVAGTYVTVSGAVPADYNGTFEVASATGSLFTVNGLPAGLVTPATTQGIVRVAQEPTHVLQYACITDASGNITFGTSITAGAAEWGQTYKSAPAYAYGEFSCADLVGLDSFALSKLGRLVQGTIAAGRVLIFGP